MRTILVTGGAGFVGSNLIKQLLRTRDSRVICMDNFDPYYNIAQKHKNIRPFETDENFKLHIGDVRRMEDFEGLEQINVIVHLAAKAGIRPSIDHSKEYYDVNVLGTQAVMEFARISNIKQVVFASSSSVYGLNKNSLWQEDGISLPISPYASSKLSAESIGHVYSHLYGIRFIALRLFTVYGPGQRPDLAIHKFLKAIYDGNEIAIYGDGQSSRDYTYVEDTVAGIIAAIDYDKSVFEIINLGNGEKTNILTLLNHLEQMTGKTAKINFTDSQPGDVLHTCSDNSKAKELLNYSPSTKIKDGLSKFYNWFDSNVKDIELKVAERCLI